MSAHGTRTGRRTSTGEPHKRRPNACEPCRNSKSKCDGRLPCTQCTKKRVKPQCIYRNPHPGSLTGRDEVEGPASSANALHSDPAENSDWESSLHNSAQSAVEHNPPSAVYAPSVFATEFDLFGANSLGRCIDQFKLLSPNDDQKPYCEAIEQCKGDEVFSRTEANNIHAPPGDLSQETDTFRTSTFTQTPLIELPEDQYVAPYLVALYHKAMSILQLIRQGKIVAAWLDLPRLIREAEFSGLDQNEGRPMTYLLEAETRRRVWWQIMELDIQISLHIGRPLTNKPNHDMARPDFFDLSPQQKELERSKLDFRQYMLDVWDKLSANLVEQPESLNFESLVERSQLSRLEALQQKLPHPPLRGTADKDVALAMADHEIEFYVVKLFICCRLARSKAKMAKDTSEKASKSSQTKDTPVLSSPATPKTNRLRKSQRLRTYEYQKDILNAARRVLIMFERIKELDAQEIGRMWTRCFGAYCAASILAIARIRGEIDAEADSQLVERAWMIFRGLTLTGQVNFLFSLSVLRLGDLVSEIRTSQREFHGRSREWSDQNVLENPVAMNTHASGGKSRSSPNTKNDITPRPKRRHEKIEEAGSSPSKRPRIAAVDKPNTAQLPQEVGWSFDSHVLDETLNDDADVSLSTSFATTYSDFCPSTSVSAATSFQGPDQGMWTQWMPQNLNGYELPPNFHPPMALDYLNTFYQHHMPSNQHMMSEFVGTEGLMSGHPSTANFSAENTAHNAVPLNQNPYGAGTQNVSGPGIQTVTNQIGQQQEIEFRNETGDSIRNPELGPAYNQNKRRGDVSAYGDRRKSVTDAQHRQDTAWNVETPANWAEGKFGTRSRALRDDVNTFTESHSEGTRTPTRGDQGKEPLQLPEVPASRIRKIIPPMTLPSVQPTTQQTAGMSFQPRIQTQFSRPASAEGSNMVQPQSNAINSAYSQMTSPTGSLHFSQQYPEVWTAPGPQGHLDAGPDPRHEMVFDPNHQARFAQEQAIHPPMEIHPPMIYPPMMVGGPYDNQDYNGSWYH